MPAADRPRVLIAGGGFAAIEALLALRALADGLVSIQLISPSAEFVYRPMATAEPFDDTVPMRFDLPAIARAMDAGHTRDSVEAVAPAAHQVRLASHARIGYDFLLLALGARPHQAVAGATTFRDQRDIPAFRRVLLEMWTRQSRRLVFAVPSTGSWSLPMYELALQTAAESDLLGHVADIAIVTPEQAPLELFGESASALVAELLERRGIRFVGGHTPARFERGGVLRLRPAGELKADRVIAAPKLVGPHVAGIPSSWTGFVPVDRRGRVEGLEDVFAAGDMTTHPIKQGGLATQQADAVAHQIAGRAGAPVKELRLERELRARLIGGDRPLILRAALDDTGAPHHASWLRGQVADDPETKVASRYLAGFLREHPELAAATG